MCLINQLIHKSIKTKFLVLVLIFRTVEQQNFSVGSFPNNTTLWNPVYS